MPPAAPVTHEQLVKAIFRELCFSVLVEQRCAAGYVPTFDLEEYLGAEWFEQMSREHGLDGRGITALPTPELIEALGRAAARFLGPANSPLRPIARK